MKKGEGRRSKPLHVSYYSHVLKNSLFVILDRVTRSHVTAIFIPWRKGKGGDGSIHTESWQITGSINLFELVKLVSLRTFEIRCASNVNECLDTSYSCKKRFDLYKRYISIYIGINVERNIINSEAHVNDLKEKFEQGSLRDSRETRQLQLLQ